MRRHLPSSEWKSISSVRATRQTLKFTRLTPLNSHQLAYSERLKYLSTVSRSSSKKGMHLSRRLTYQS
jgi:hypothetical protein